MLQEVYVCFFLSADAPPPKCVEKNTSDEGKESETRRERNETAPKKVKFDETTVRIVIKIEPRTHGKITTVVKGLGAADERF